MLTWWPNIPRGKTNAALFFQETSDPAISFFISENSLQKFHFYVRTPLKTSFLIEYFLKKTSFPSRKFSSALRSQSTFTDDTQLRWPQTDKDMELVADTVILYCFKESHSINEVALCFQIVFSLKEILLNLKKTFSNIKKTIQKL